MKGTGFTQYIIALFVSPLYFALQRRWGAFAVNGFFYLLALATLPLFGIGVIFWMFCFAHAAWDLRGRLVEEGASVLAAKMAAELHARQQVPPSGPRAEERV